MAESLALLLAEAGPALMYGGAAAEGAAAGGAAGAGLLGAGAAAAGTGEAVSGTYGLTAAELAAMEGTAAAGTGEAVSGAYGLTAEELAAMNGGGMDATAAFQQSDAVYGGSDQLSQYQNYLNKSKDGFRSLGKMVNKMPPGSTQAMTGLFGGGGQGQQTNITPPRPQGGGQQSSPTPFLGQPLPQVTPYAPTLGGSDDLEMKRRLMLMMQMQGMRG